MLLYLRAPTLIYSGHKSADFSNAHWNVFTMEANTMDPDQTAPKGAV